MKNKQKREVLNILKKNKSKILKKWLGSISDDLRIQDNPEFQRELKENSQEFVDLLIKSASSGNFENINTPEYKPLVSFLDNYAEMWKDWGFTLFELASHLSAFKEIWISFMVNELKDKIHLVPEYSVIIAKLLDKLIFLMLSNAVKRREKVIAQQSEHIMEVSTPTIEVWEGIVAVPLVGTLDTPRAQLLMEVLLKHIVDTKSSVAIIDITGVPTIDTRTAQHLIETITAVKLLGAQVILTGVRPEIAQTIVYLGIDLSGLITRSSLASGLRVAFGYLGLKVVKKDESKEEKI